MDRKSSHPSRRRDKCRVCRKLGYAVHVKCGKRQEEELDGFRREKGCNK